MSFFKKLGHKVGGRRSKHSGEADATVSDMPEEVKTVEIRRAEVDEATEAQGSGRSLPLPSSGRPEEGSVPNWTQSQTVNISGGTFTEAYIRTQINIRNVSDDTDDSKLFVALSPAAAAHDCQEVSSKATECFPGTRRQLLLEIENWRMPDSSVPIFILDGIAGIGKTTVVKTVCARAASERRLAASWFFSRDQQDRKSTRAFVGTLAFQLSKYHPALRDRVTQALKDQPDILQKTIRAQFDALVHEPLLAMLKDSVETHTITIDAIDECDLDEATEILSILLGAVPQHPQLRLLITCRPERPFRLLLQKHRGPHVFHLHEIENSVVESDIRLYINYRLSPEEVDNALPDLLPPPWRASAKEKEALVQMAGKLFIVASTAVNFILDSRRLAPAKQMRLLLDAAAGSGLVSSPMDRLYTQMLRAAVPDPVDDWFDDYQVVVGVIVVAADVLPVQSLASLLDKEPNDIVRTLSHLHSLIAPTNQTEAFRVHHKSFPDFVTDPSRCSIDSRFLIDVSASHFHLAGACLRVMVRMLKQNICDLPFSDWSKELSELLRGTTGRIPSELAYACIHWIPHFQQGLSHFNGDKDAALVDLLGLFVDEHLLSWLEVVALTGRFDTVWNSMDLLSEAISLIHPKATGIISHHLSHVTSVLKDFLRFINLHPNLPGLCPMHIYLSSLPFAPGASIMSKLYAKCLSNESIQVVSGVDPDWNPVAVLFKAGGVTTDMRLSPCGATVAIVTDALRLYNVKSGEQIREFVNKRPWPYFRGRITFSLDGCLVAVVVQTLVCIWNVASGEHIAEFEIASEMLTIPFEGKGKESWTPWLTSIAFTGDGTSITAGAVDGTLFLWQIEGGSPRQILHNMGKSGGLCCCPPNKLLLEPRPLSKGQLATCPVHSVEGLITLPSPLPFILVRRSNVQFWDLAPVKLLATVPCHTRETRGCPTSLSHDKTMLAIECTPGAISIYSTRQLCCVAVLSGHEEPITAMAFALDLEQLCSASQDMTVRIWHITTSTQLQIIPIWPTILTDAVFAKSIGRFIFRNEDRMVMISDDECIAFGPAVPRGDPLNLVQLSPDGSTVAIYSAPFTVFSSLSDVADTPPFDLDPTSSYSSRFSPTGDLVTVWNKRLGSLEVVISDLNGDGRELASTSFQISDIEAAASFVISPDVTRVAVTAWVPSSVAVYNLSSQRLEAFLEPLPFGAKTCIHFSWDSQTVYAERLGSFYGATLPSSKSRSQTCSKETTPVIAMSKYEHGPTPIWGLDVGVRSLRVPPAHQLHFLARDRAWFLQNPQIPRNWAHINLSSLPAHIEAMTYSPNGLLVAVVGKAKHDMSGGTPSVIQLRSLPDYNIIGSLEDHQHTHGTKIQFVPSLPHILVAQSWKGLTSWNTVTLETLGHVYFSDSSIFLRLAHPYSASDFLCLVQKKALGLTVGLAAVRLRGARLAKVCYLCWFPPHLSIEYTWLEVNPRHPHIIALKGGKRPLLMDISQFPLPFTL